MEGIVNPGEETNEKDEIKQEIWHVLDCENNHLAQETKVFNNPHEILVLQSNLEDQHDFGEYFNRIARTIFS